THRVLEELLSVQDENRLLRHMSHGKSQRISRYHWLPSGIAAQIEGNSHESQPPQLPIDIIHNPFVKEELPLLGRDLNPCYPIAVSNPQILRPSQPLDAQFGLPNHS